MSKVSLDSVSRADLLKALSDLQYALDGLWSDGYNMSRDTGVPEDDADGVMNSINLLLSINTKG